MKNTIPETKREKEMIYFQWADATSPHEAWWTKEQATKWAENDS